MNVRVISATNANLGEEVANNRFREDLLFRLNTIEIRIPPLRERREDIPELVRHFTARFAAEEGKSFIRGVTAPALDLLLRFDWPGNIRQLENAVERAVIITRSDHITVDDLRDEILHPAPVSRPGGASRAAAQIDLSLGVSFYDEVNGFQKDLILRALEITSGHQSRAAKLLGMNTTTLNSKIKYFGIR